MTIWAWYGFVLLMICELRISGFARSVSFMPSDLSTALPECFTSAWASEWNSRMPKWRSTIIRPGRTLAALTAASVNWLIITPGATSTIVEAIPGTGRYPLAFAPTYAAY